jgi:GAF domain-containing protein
VTIAPDASPTAPSQLTRTTLRAAAGVTGMQLAFVSAIDEQTYTWRTVYGNFDGVSAGISMPLTDTFCARLLGGAPASTADASIDPAYADVPLRSALGVTSYVGVPLRRSGVVTGTLGCLDASASAVDAADVRVLAALARIISAEAARDPEVWLRRTVTGWEVEQGDGVVLPAEDLTVSMSLADLIAGESGEIVPAQRPQRPSEDLSEGDRLRLQITQLEHALSARVVIEQAIGVIAQRFSLTPRESFDRMRSAARSRGQRAHELAVSVVRSARDDAVTLPRDLA